MVRALERVASIGAPPVAQRLRGSENRTRCDKDPRWQCYLDRVKKGEALTVTEHGAQVAILRPLPAAPDTLARLVAEGRATPPSRGWHTRPRPQTVTLETPLAEILDEGRNNCR